MRLAPWKLALPEQEEPEVSEEEEIAADSAEAGEMTEEETGNSKKKHPLRDVFSFA